MSTSDANQSLNRSDTEKSKPRAGMETSSGAAERILDVLKRTMIHAGYPEPRRKMAEQLAKDDMAAYEMEALMDILMQSCNGNEHKAAARATYWLTGGRWREFLSDAATAAEARRTHYQPSGDMPDATDQDIQMARGNGMEVDEWREESRRQGVWAAVRQDQWPIEKAAKTYRMPVSEARTVVAAIDEERLGDGT